MSKAKLRTGGRARACAAALVVALLGSVFCASAAQALPAKFWGVVPQHPPSDEQFQLLKRGGVESVRIPVDWGTAQSQRGASFDWSHVDGLVRKAANSGVEVLPFLTGAPAWAVPHIFVPGTGRSVKAPARLPATGSAAGAWKGFVEAAVARYGSDGSFWAENPIVPKRPIKAWQIWNEENFKYFVAKPNPAQYGKLVKLSSNALKRVDPTAKAILGGMFALPKGCRSKAKPKRAWCAADFLAEMYRKTPGVKTKFDGVSLHPYSYSFQELRPRIEEFREVLEENRDAGKSLWITELGWSSKPRTRTNLFAKGLNGQAAQLKGAFSMLKSRQAKWKIQRVYWFSVDDQNGACNFCDGSGLFSHGFVPKKSWYAYVRFAGGTA